jgi:hypothetical protein
VRHHRSIAAAVLAIALLLGGQTTVRADNELAAARPTFYILAPGGDNSIGPLVHALTDSVQALFDRAQGAGTVWVIPRVAWAPSDLQSQCENDPAKDDPKGPHVIGGLILEGTNTYSSIDPFVLLSHGWAKVSSNAEIVSCKPAGYEKPTIAWVANDVHGYGSRNGLPFENVAAGILALTVKSGDAKAIALGSAIGGDSGASTIPPVNDALTSRDAALRVANDLIQRLNAACSLKDKSILPMCAQLGLPSTNLKPPPSD